MNDDISKAVWFDWNPSATLPSSPGAFGGDYRMEWVLRNGHEARGENTWPTWNEMGEKSVARYRWTDSRVMLRHPATGKLRHPIDIMQDPEGRGVVVDHRKAAEDVGLLVRSDTNTTKPPGRYDPGRIMTIDVIIDVLRNPRAWVAETRERAANLAAGMLEDELSKMTHACADIRHDRKHIKEQRLHNHYFKDVSHIDTIDVYRVLVLFAVTDPCIQHAVKKLLVAGGRGAGKDIARDIKEAIDSLQRWQDMRREDGETREELVKDK